MSRICASTHFQPAPPSAWLTARNLLKPLEPLDAFRITQAKETIIPWLTYMEAGRARFHQPDLLDSIRNKVIALLWNKSRAKSGDLLRFATK